MIRPPGFRGAAFGGVAEGDGRVDEQVRSELHARFGLPPEWAFATQVHGAAVVRVETPGRQGEADALYTTTPGISLTVATADCVPIVLEGPDVVAVIHAGWRGAAAGVIDATLAAIEQERYRIERAAIGPSIGPCCYEVGEEVVSEFGGHAGTTSWGTRSVDLGGFAASRLQGLELWRDDRCTYTDHQLNSYRRDRTDRRQVTLAWLPTG